MRHQLEDKMGYSNISYGRGMTQDEIDAQDEKMRKAGWTETKTGDSGGKLNRFTGSYETDIEEAGK
jgi:hypothetical protein